MFIQPLTEKTSNEPYDHEIIANTETGDISVKDSKGSVISPTKDIKRDIAIQEELLKVISVVSEEVYQEMKKIETRIIKSRNNVEALERRLEDLNDLNTNIQNSLNEIESMNIGSSDKLLLIHELAHELVIVFSKIIPDIERVEKRMKHFFYLKDILITNRRQMEKDVNALGHRKTQIEEMLETKQDRSEYITWVNKLVRDYNALKSSSKVSQMSYTYNQPNGGH